MSGINTVTLVGRLTADPELRKTQGGMNVSHFTIAVDRRSKDTGTDFIRCVAWKQSAEYLTQYGSKGRLVGLTGRIRTGSYSDRETGKTIYTTEIDCDNLTFLDSKTKTDAPKEEKTEYQKDVEAYQSSFASDASEDVPW